MIDAPMVWEGGSAEVETATIPTILQAWAAARGLRLVAPREGAPHAIEVDATLALRVEENLHQARELVTQHDADGAERALARGEALLRAHPELPQAAWLMAEIERGWASRFARLDPTDVARAARHWRAAAALDGGRAAGVGEITAPAEPRVAFTLDARVQPSTELRWDGDPIAPGDRATAPGVHQLVAKENGSVVFAQWIAIAQAGTVVRVALPAPAPCTREDLASATTCANWISVKRADNAARSADPTFVVRVCSGGACGPELTVAPFEWKQTPNKKRGLPVWATWTIAGVGIAAALGAAAWVITYFALPAIQQTRWTTTTPQ